MRRLNSQKTCILWLVCKLSVILMLHYQVTPSSSSSSSSPNWLTAEDILKAAESEDGKFTHSPILLIPYDQQKTQDLNLDLETLPQNIFSTNNFAILDTLSAQLLEENDKVGQFLDKNGITSQSSNEDTVIPRVGTSSVVKH